MLEKNMLTKLDIINDFLTNVIISPLLWVCVTYAEVQKYYILMITQSFLSKILSNRHRLFRITSMNDDKKQFLFFCFLNKSNTSSTSNDLCALLTSFTFICCTTITLPLKSCVFFQHIIFGKGIWRFCPIILPKIDHLKSSK